MAIYGVGAAVDWVDVSQYFIDNNAAGGIGCLLNMHQICINLYSL